MPLFPNAAAPLAQDDLGGLRAAVSEDAGWRREAALILVERGLASMHEHVRHEALEALTALVADTDPDVAASARTLWRSRGLGDLPAGAEQTGDEGATSHVVGIDFGTTNSAVGVFHRGEVRMVPNPEGGLVTPSVVAFLPDGTIEVGERARRASGRIPTKAVRSVKLKLGTDWTLEASGRRYSAEDVAAIVLRRLLDDARRYVHGEISGAVLTVPAQFDLLQRQSLVAAGEQAGLHIWRVVTEPTAAATTLGLNTQGTDATVLIFDLGGGTLDVSLLEIGDGVCEVKAAMGDNHLGGDDWDLALVQHLLAHVRSRIGVDLRSDPTALNRLSEAARAAKIELSAMRQTEVHLLHIATTDSGSHDLDLIITRSQFEGLTHHLLQRCRRPLQQVAADAGIVLSRVDQVILIGGATRMPAIASLVRDVTGREPLRSIIPEGVVLGATLHAGILNGDVKDVLLLDVTAKPLGIELAGNVMTKIVDRNTTIPTKRSEEFIVPTSSDGRVQVHILEGDVEEAAQARSLALIELADLHLSDDGGARVDVCFEVEANGLVRVEARDPNGEGRQSVTVGRESARSAKQRRAHLTHLPAIHSPPSKA